MDQRYKKLIELIGKEKVEVSKPLAQYTTFKIGGPADLFVEIESEKELVRALGVVREMGVPYFILGGGSNILVADKGFRGMMIKCQMSNVKCQMLNREGVVEAEGGVLLRTLLDECMKNSLTGLEFMAGIPGTVGGAVRGNAGAWQKSIGEFVSRVKILAEDGKIKWINKDGCQFNYRESRFKHSDEVVLGVELVMGKGDQKEIEGQIKYFLETRSTQPKEPSAGCIFVNPKPLSAGELIEKCGLKGTKIGQAQISEKHANFIINLGGAKAVDVVRLIDLAKRKVGEKFNFDLKEEIVRMGEF